MSAPARSTVVRSCGAVRTLSIAVLLSAGLAGVVDAAPTARVRTSTGPAASGETISVAIEIDPATPGQALGSYGAVLAWNPAHLLYVSDSGGGDAPFDIAVVNRADVIAGVLRFSDASPIGATGGVKVLNVTFLVRAQPCLTTQLDLSITSLFSDTFLDLLPGSLVIDGSVHVNDYFFNLQVSGAQNTILTWNSIAGAVRYDVIRGSVDAIFDDGVSIRLGTVVCLENNSFDTTTGAGSEPANPDLQQPLPGEAFFYLVRHLDGTGNRTYGFLQQCSRERLPDAGDCP